MLNWQWVRFTGHFQVSNYSVVYGACRNCATNFRNGRKGWDVVQLSDIEKVNGILSEMAYGLQNFAEQD